MPDHKALLDAIENATKINRMIEDAGGNEVLIRRMEEATRASRVFEEAGVANQLAKQIEQITNPNFIAQQHALNEQLERMEIARRAMQPAFAAMDLDALHMSLSAQALALRLPEINLPQIAQFKAIEEAQRLSASIDLMFRPSTVAAQQIAEHVAQLTEPHRVFAENLTAWSKSLELRIDQIDAAWVMNERLAISSLAFGNLAHFRDVVRYDAPFSEQTNEIVTEELGEVVEEIDESPDDREAQYDHAGRNPSLVAFPAPAFDSVVIASGFVLTFPAAPMPQPIENGAGVLAISDLHHAALRDIENHLRAFISTQLSLAEPQWEKRLVPGNMRRNWLERQEVDRHLGRPVYPPIYYADLAELGQIIAQNNNWPLFQPFFETRDGMLVSLSRLTPIRNAIAHGRPLSQTDVLYIVAEGARLMKAIGQAVLN